MIPRLIHMVYIPWGKDQKLLADWTAFDHRPYENMKQYAPGFEVRLWTRPEVENFYLDHYPAAWPLVRAAARPMVIVDLLRWLLVYRFGGIYWQYDMNPLVPMERFLPSPGKKVRLFTEFVLSPAECLRAAKEPIRQGEPEEPLRIVNQAFSAEAGHPFLKAVADLILDRVQRYELKTDYDLLYISANAVVSTAYDRFGKNDVSIELVPRSETRQMMKIQYKGTWRTQRSPDHAESANADAGRRFSAVTFCKKVVKALPLVVGAWYRFVRTHPHEAVFEHLPDAVDWSETLIDAFRRLVAEYGIRSVWEYPCGEYSLRKAHLFKELRHIAGSPVRRTVARNRGKVVGGDVDVQFMNLMYSRIPRRDLVLCRDFFDYLDQREILQILRRLVRSGCTYLLATTHPLLNSNWDGALGDWRPLNFTLPPFSFDPPLRTLPDPDGGRRPDRSLGLWRLEEIGTKVKAA